MQTVGTERRQTVNAWVALVVLAGLIAAGLYIAQGGFGGGHDRFDQAIVILTIPGFFVLPFFLLLPKSLATSKLLDFCIVIVVPICINVVLVRGTQRLMGKKR